ncbi:MAG TPA: hypothetical protein VFF65_06200 [Phycisphaerales bacterium]|nr:hypothetical protein [Phycisphaerales bacterium]
MSDSDIDINCVSIGPDGRVVLGDEALEQLARRAELVLAGSDASTNRKCTNSASCGGSSNATCTNLASCSGTTDVGCRNTGCGTQPH